MEFGWGAEIDLLMQWLGHCHYRKERKKWVGKKRRRQNGREWYLQRLWRVWGWDKRRADTIIARLSHLVWSCWPYFYVIVCDQCYWIGLQKKEEEEEVSVCWVEQSRVCAWRRSWSKASKPYQLCFGDQELLLSCFQHSLPNL